MIDMKFDVILILAILVVSCGIPLVSAETPEETLLKNVSEVPLLVPTMEPAVLGTTAYMDAFQNWLVACSFNLVHYSNTLLPMFGMNEMDWEKEIPAPSPIMAAPVMEETIVPTLPDSPLGNDPKFRTAGTITGGSGTTTADIIIPSGYWELWYTADPLVTGGQDSHSATGTNSAVFPTLVIKIIDKKSGNEIETVEPPGGLDIMLWQRAGDPRPWIQKFYRGNKEFSFVITAKHVRSFTIEARVPDE
jgi:hypothetical protein